MNRRAFATRSSRCAALCRRHSPRLRATPQAPAAPAAHEPPAAPARRAGARRRGAPAAAHPPAGAPHPFKDVVKDAKQIPGLLHRSGRRTRRSGSRSRPDQMDKPFYFAAVRTSGLGERFVIARPHGRALRRLFPQGARPGAADREEHALHGARTAPRSSTRSPTASPTACSPPRRSASEPASRHARDPGRGERAAAGRHRRRLDDAREGLPPALRARREELERHARRSGPEATGFNVSLHFAVPKLPAPPVPSPAPGRSPRRPSTCPIRAASSSATTTDFAQLPGAHAPAHRRRARGLLHHPAHGLRQRRQPEPERVLRQPLAPGEEGSRRRRSRSR